MHTPCPGNTGDSRTQGLGTPGKCPTERTVASEYGLHQPITSSYASNARAQETILGKDFSAYMSTFLSLRSQ
jgi:hypothetical protein